MCSAAMCGYCPYAVWKEKVSCFIALCTPVWEFILSTNITYVLKLPFWHLYVSRQAVDPIFMRNVWVIATLPLIPYWAKNSAGGTVCLMHTTHWLVPIGSCRLMQRVGVWNMVTPSWKERRKRQTFPLLSSTEFCGFFNSSSCNLQRQRKQEKKTKNKPKTEDLNWLAKYLLLPYHVLLVMHCGLRLKLWNTTYPKLWAAVPSLPLHQTSSWSASSMCAGLRNCSRHGETRKAWFLTVLFLDIFELHPPSFVNLNLKPGRALLDDLLFNIYQEVCEHRMVSKPQTMFCDMWGFVGGESAL